MSQTKAPTMPHFIQVQFFSFGVADGIDFSKAIVPQFLATLDKKGIPYVDSQQAIEDIHIDADIIDSTTVDLYLEAEVEVWNQTWLEDSMNYQKQLQAYFNDLRKAERQKLEIALK